MGEQRQGGINLNPDLLDLKIKRNGSGVPLPMAQQPIGQMKIDGFVPIIINVTPISLPQLLGLADEEDSFDRVQGNRFSTQNLISRLCRYRPCMPPR